MKRRILFPLLAAASLGTACLLFAPSNPTTGGSCATFVLERGPDALLVGHNLDEAMPVPGLVVANLRGVARENRTYGDIKSSGRSGSAPRIAWVSKYGSLTYNVFGREFPDGGLNEAGFYAGEMTLLKTEWPEGGPQARFYHHQWMQYLLDNFATVEEALASLDKALPEGHCRWHFLLADKSGDAAVVEFLKGKPTIYHGKSLPYPILCNDPYKPEVDEIKMYAGFGGTKKPELRYDPEDPRFRWAAVMLADADAPATSDRAFAVLQRIDFGTTKWSVVYDLKNMKLWFKTNVSRKIKWVDFSAFDFKCASGPLAFDIHSPLEGDVSKKFAPLTDAANREAIERSFKEIDAGFLGNLVWKPFVRRGLAHAAAEFQCTDR
jgi:choloylglycine hydrolase